MNIYENREAFIPYSRQEIIEFCLQEGKLSTAQVKKFQDFCQILAAYYHFKFHYLLEDLKSSFMPYSPEKEEHNHEKKLNRNQSEKLESKLTSRFQELLEKANYIPLPRELLEKSLKKRSLIELNTEVNFNDFDKIVCYYRGVDKKEVTVKKWFRKIPKNIELLKRVAVLIKYKNNKNFQEKDKEKSDFDPEKVYVYLYKNIPKFDINFILPNVEIKMTLKDKIAFVVYVVGAAIPMLLKIFPRLLLVIGVILFLVWGESPIEQIQVDKEDVNDLMPILFASLSVIVTFGVFAFKRYLSYKNKHIKFQKKVTDTLFFRKLAINLGVFQSLIDAAEEEECKEIILVYYHLLTTNTPFKPEGLDKKIEKWIMNNFDEEINFDIHNTLQSLTKIKGKITITENNVYRQVEKSLLSFDEDGYCQVLSIDEAKEVIDYIWDNVFNYSFL